jgi:hypothetical protein
MSERAATDAEIREVLKSVLETVPAGVGQLGTVMYVWTDADYDTARVMLDDARESVDLTQQGADQ